VKTLQDRGLAAERTTLAWHRTCWAAAVLVAIVMRNASSQSPGLLVVAGIAGALIYAALLTSTSGDAHPGSPRTARIAALTSSALVLTSAAALVMAVEP
jgi:hypothetical protein